MADFDGATNRLVSFVVAVGGSLSFPGADNRLASFIVSIDGLDVFVVAGGLVCFDGAAN